MDNFRSAHGRDGYSEDYAVQNGGRDFASNPPFACDWWVHVDSLLVKTAPLDEAAALAVGHRLLWRLWLWTLPTVDAPEPWSSWTATGGSRCPENVSLTESRGLDIDGGDGNYRGDLFQIEESGFRLRREREFFPDEESDYRPRL